MGGNRIIDPVELWGKSNKADQAKWHPLLLHMLDAAAVTSMMWEKCLANDLKNDLSKTFGLKQEEMGNLLAFWVSLHDIGKAAPGFQKKNQDRFIALREMGLPFQESIFEDNGFHGTATTCILRKHFGEAGWQMPRKFRIGLAETLGGHHGIFPSNQEVNDYNDLTVLIEYKTWQSLQWEIFNRLETTIYPNRPLKYPEHTDEINAVLLIVSGLCSTADWIASNEDFFGYYLEPHDLTRYYENSRIKAIEALSKLGWIGWQPNGQIISFESMFPGFTPNPIQQATIGLSDDIRSPFLVIIEAQTGSGKTEAALYLADALLQRENKSGIYLAMPTQATSNQMFQRVSKFLARRYAEQEINLHLVHGKALFNPKTSGFPISSIWSEAGETEGNLHSYSWFLPRKRTLLAPFGVGTVDQTFLSVLRSRHFFVRLFGLSHKVLVFDEVHAYDVYMTEIFKNLLHWLQEVGTSVIILSATLTKAERKDLLDAYTGKDNQVIDIPFPRITASYDDQVKVIQAGKAQSRTIRLTWVDRSVEKISQCVQEHLDEGGCAAIICNTVKRAQELTTALRAAYQSEPIDILLFHGRFPYQWRKETEDKVLDMFGKNRQHRPKKAIVIATQVIEQSLDLDFDLLISDLAPIDLLIQRIGRLHRHSLGANRPQKLKDPEFILSSFDTLERITSHYEDSYIYFNYILGKTFLALQGKDSLVLPDETDDLIEFVYSEQPNEDPGLEKARDDMTKAIEKSKTNAQNYMIPKANKDFIGSLQNFFGDDPGSLSQKYIQAPTREMDASLQIVCLEAKGEETMVFGKNRPIDLNKDLSPEEISDCLSMEVTISTPGLIEDLLKQSDLNFPAFQSTAALRWHVPVFFRDNACETEHYCLTLNKEIGLQIRRKE